MATANPTNRVRAARAKSVRRRRTRASPRAAMATNSGPRTIAPMTRIGESTTIAIPARRVARVMKAR
jgi:hypothetical protein